MNINWFKNILILDQNKIQYLKFKVYVYGIELSVNCLKSKLKFMFFKQIKIWSSWLV